MDTKQGQSTVTPTSSTSKKRDRDNDSSPDSAEKKAIQSPSVRKASRDGPRLANDHSPVTALNQLFESSSKINDVDKKPVRRGTGDDRVEVTGDGYNFPLLDTPAAVPEARSELNAENVTPHPRASITLSRNNGSLSPDQEPQSGTLTDAAGSNIELKDAADTNGASFDGCPPSSTIQSSVFNLSAPAPWKKRGHHDNDNSLNSTKGEATRPPDAREWDQSQRRVMSAPEAHVQNQTEVAHVSRQGVRLTGYSIANQFLQPTRAQNDPSMNIAGTGSTQISSIERQIDTMHIGARGQSIPPTDGYNRRGLHDVAEILRCSSNPEVAALLPAPPPYEDLTIKELLLSGAPLSHSHLKKLEKPFANFDFTNPRIQVSKLFSGGNDAAAIHEFTARSYLQMEICSERTHFPPRVREIYDGHHTLSYKSVHEARLRDRMPDHVKPAQDDVDAVEKDAINCVKAIMKAVMDSSRAPYEQTHLHRAGQWQEYLERAQQTIYNKFNQKYDNTDVVAYERQAWSLLDKIFLTQRFGVPKATRDFFHTNRSAYNAFPDPYEKMLCSERLNRILTIVKDYSVIALDVIQGDDDKMDILVAVPEYAVWTKRQYRPR